MNISTIQTPDSNIYPVILQYHWQTTDIFPNTTISVYICEVNLLPLPSLNLHSLQKLLTTRPLHNAHWYGELSRWSPGYPSGAWRTTGEGKARRDEALWRRINTSQYLVAGHFSRGELNKNSQKEFQGEFRLQGEKQMITAEVTYDSTWYFQKEQINKV